MKVRVEAAPSQGEHKGPEGEHTGGPRASTRHRPYYGRLRKSGRAWGQRNVSFPSPGHFTLCVIRQQSLPGEAFLQSTGLDLDSALKHLAHLNMQLRISIFRRDRDLPDLHSFVTGVYQDKAAVQAGLTRSESQGQTKGHITRLKLIKRQGYGRAKFDLLRQRVLHAA